MINVIAKGKDEKEYFVLLNTRDKGLETAYLTKDEIIDKTVDLFNTRYVYTRNRESILRQIVDIVLLDEKNEAISLTTLMETTSDAEFNSEVDRLLEMSKAE